jgi:hypothetical protein
MSLDQDLVALKDKGERLNTLRIQNETQLKSLELEKDKLVAEAQALGIPSNKIEETLKAEEAAVQAEVSALNAELAKVLEQVNGI